MHAKEKALALQGGQIVDQLCTHIPFDLYFSKFDNIALHGERKLVVGSLPCQIWLRR